MIPGKRDNNDLALVHRGGDREMDLRDISEAKTDMTWYCIETDR